MTSSQEQIGFVKFVLLHHDGCNRESFHYRVESEGTVRPLLPTTMRGQHPGSLGIVISGQFDSEPPTSTQLDALKNLLVELKLQFPAYALGAHRQVRGDFKTTCPGTKFPMKDLAQWATKELIQIRNERLQTDIESQYGP